MDKNLKERAKKWRRTKKEIALFTSKNLDEIATWKHPTDYHNWAISHKLCIAEVQSVGLSVGATDEEIKICTKHHLDRLSKAIEHLSKIG